MEFLNNVSAALPDPVILALAALLLGVLGGLISLLASRYWFLRWSSHTAQEDKLADTAHTSLLGFSAFVLALAITSVFSNLAKTEEAVRLEALEIHRLDRELAPLGPTAAQARQAIASYVAAVVADEWPRLAKRPVSLSPRAEKSLDDVWRGVRAVQRELGAELPQARDALNKYMLQIEQSRAGRLAAATNSIPDVFWLVIMVFIITASFMTGRNAHKSFGLQMNVLHMAAIGIVIALIMILDNPFRGETSISSEIIAQALKS
jgi:hypothetical protein